jgi:hypothetical protein
MFVSYDQTSSNKNFTCGLGKTVLYQFLSKGFCFLYVNKAVAIAGQTSHHVFPIHSEYVELCSAWVPTNGFVFW